MITNTCRMLVAGCLTVGLMACSGAADVAAAAAEESIENRLVARIAQAERDGASGMLRIARDGRVVFQSGFGSASCRRHEPVTPAHLFMIGSITKEMTRVLGYILEEKGFLNLGMTVRDYVPDFSGDIGRVSIGQLLDHTGGLPDLIDASGQPVPYSIDYDYAPISRNELLDRAERTSLLFEPGSSEAYSNLGFQLLAAIYEVTTGISYAALLEQFIFEPAGMTDTGFWFNDNPARQFADGCLPGDQHWGNPIDDAMWDGNGPSWNLLGAGGLLSTAESLGRFFEALGKGDFFASAGQSEKYKESRMVYSDSREQRIMGPAGSNGIFNAVAFWADRSRFSVILMTNRADHQAEEGLVQDILGIFSPTY